jgi:hypothetical protein
MYLGSEGEERVHATRVEGTGMYFFLVLIHNGTLQNDSLSKLHVPYQYVTLNNGTLKKQYVTNQYNITKRYVVQNGTLLNGAVTKRYM